MTVAPNPDWLQKARKVSISKIVAVTFAYNPEGDEPITRINKLITKKEVVGQKLPLGGLKPVMGMTYPAKELRDSDGLLPPPKPAFPMHPIAGFTTAATLYKIDYFLTVKVKMP